MQQSSSMDASPVSHFHTILKEEYFGESHILNLLPSAVYVCDASGKIINYNRKAAELWGRTPVKGASDELYCGSFKLYYPDGKYLPHNQTPVAACLSDGMPREDLEVIIERPDSSLITVRVNIVPIKDDKGNIQGMINSFYDITEQKKTQKEVSWKTNQLQDYVTEQKKLFTSLKKSEEQYRSLISAIPAGVYTCNKEGLFTFYNEAAVAMWGCKPVLNESSFRFCGWHKVMDLDGNIIPAHQTPMALALQSNRSFRNLEAIVERENGERFYVGVNIDSLVDEAGNVTGAINVFQDITTLKQTGLALKVSENRYKKLIHSLDTPLYTTDVEGKLTLFNKAAADLWGREPVIGTDLWCGSYKIFNPDGSELPLEDCPMAVCLKERRAVLDKEIIVVRPDGTLRNVAPHPQPIFNEEGHMIGAINMLVDVTEIKRKEQAIRESEKKYRDLAASLERKVEEKLFDLKQKNEELKKSEERYHKMVEEVEDYAIILLNENGIVQNWNKGAEKIKGYKEEEIVNKSFSMFYLPEHRDSGLPQRLLKEASEKGKALHEGWRMRKDGTKFWGSIVLTALHDDQDNIIGFSKVTRDLTERKMAEDKMKDYTSQLEFQNKELEQFAYAASHDMKEPLRKIHLYNSFISEHPENILDEKSKEYLDRSVAATKRMTVLIEDLLTYSRTTSNVENFEEVDLNAIVEEIKSTLKEEFEQKKVQMEVDRLPIIHAVPFQMEQLFINLISNAIKYKHPQQNVRIQIKAEVVNGFEIYEGDVLPYKTYKKISIIDNGIGFDQENADKIFAIFQRLSNQSGSQGSGIGLAICKRIVQNHHGFIKAFGKENEGARFEFFLPAG